MDILNKTRLLQTSILSGLIMGMGSVSFAQTTNTQDDTQIDDPVVEEVTPVVEEDDGDEIVVTGSRIKRDEFNSIAPIQIVDFEAKRDVGLIDPVTILQTTESAAGTQIDSAFSGFVLDNGPGSETIDIRGLGPDRTLVLINGRRMAPAGVEGAPSQPSINLIPSSLINRADILLEGASSVYGSDAVAGVVNVLLKQDFEGLEVTATADVADQGAGDDYNIAGSWGKNFDRGFFGVGAEYDFRDEVTLADRDWFRGCDTHYEITEDGEIRTQDQQDEFRNQVWYGGSITAADQGPCKSAGIAGRLFETSNTFGSIYFNPEGSNIGIPGYVDQTLAGVPLDTNGDGVQDFGFQEFSINGNDLETSIIAEQERVNLMAIGEYTFGGSGNITAFGEAIYSKVESEADLGTFQLFPTVGADNPFNPCGVNGSDCGSNSLVIDQALVDRWNTYQRDIDPNRDGNTADARICATFFAQFDADGNLIPGTGPFDNAACTPFLFGYGPGDFIGPVDVQPVIGINGDRTNYAIEIEQTRLVGGLRGDLNFLNNMDRFENWSFEASLSHSISKGVSERPGIRDDRLNFALGNDLVSGNPIPGLAPCTVPAGQTYSADVTNGCVPVNLFAPSVYEGVAGDFATAAERDYLFDVRDFDTEYTQSVLSAFASGKIGETAAGDIQAVVGMEYRWDEIASIPDDVASEGLFFGFFSDQGAEGKKWVRELYGEVDIPLVADKTLFNKLEANVSGRLLEDEFYGTHAVYAVKGGWRPTESLLLKASYGTSFRSPNLRENFLRPQSGFLTLTDPCAVPAAALITPPGGGAEFYDRSQDTRTDYTLQRCRDEGLDPETLGGGGTGRFSTEVFNAGNLDLDPETSTSLTLGAAFEEDISDSSSISFGGSYYNINVKQSVISPSGQFIINDCFVNERNDRSPFCGRITRDADGIFDLVDLGFINQDEDEVEGIDFNANYKKEIAAFDRSFDFEIDARANHILEARQLFVNDDGSTSEDNDEGEFGFARWVGSATTSLSYSDVRLTWFSRYVGKVRQDPDGLDDFANALGVDLDGDGISDAFSDTCGGPAAGDVNCRDVGFAGDYWVHNVGLSYNNEELGFGATFAINNVFDKAPPLVDSSEVTAVSNTPIGAGYDINGRKFFLQLRKTF